MSSLINRGYFTSFINKIFGVFHFLIKFVTEALRAVNRLFVHFVSSKVDASLSYVAKWVITKRTKVENSTVMFVPMQGEYVCNTKYICEEVLRRKLPYRLVWAYRGVSMGPHPEGVEYVKAGSEEYYNELAKAKIIIQNGHALQKDGVTKNDDQLWFQTWHGSLGLKRLEGAGGDDKFYKKMQRLDNKQTDYVITNSQFEEDVFKSTYWSDVPASRLGHARNDILFDTSKPTNTQLRKKVLNRLGIKDKGQKFLLFAPTHDDKNPEQAFGNLDFKSLKESLGKKFGGEWEFLIRTHNNNKKKSGKWLAGLPLYCHNASFYPDIQEILVIADVGLTDYSSWICDYILTKKPSFLFGTNVRKFNETRGFYHKIEDTPFSMAVANQELLDNIDNFNKKDYEKKIEVFLESCDSIDDGKSSERIVSKIDELIRKS
jgi:CDP-glycerol glycerophosphotransferase